MRRTRFVMIGGFLGAGKTTVLARLARDAMEQGLRVGIVTNDQAQGLVDTESLRSQGFQVGEVAGACFCCQFDDLVQTIATLSDQQQPDLILAEPVGSCTDLVATVIEPLRQRHGDRFDVGPLAVLLKPEHGGKILREEQGGGFSPKAAYIFLKQIEEADVVALNKIDKLDATETKELIALVERRFPAKKVIGISARSGEGWSAFVEALEQSPHAGRVTMAMDYDVYAEGEAELGWLNCRVTITKREGLFSLDPFVLELTRRLSDRCDEGSVEPAHLKVLATSGGDLAVANVVASGQGAELSQSSQATTSSATLIVNARVATDPEWLVDVVTSEIECAVREIDAEALFVDLQRLRPGRPVPTHRIESS